MREKGFLGWATGPLVKLDDAAPGVLARVLTAAPTRRQAIFAALAHWRPESADAPLADLAEIVRHGRPADILRHALENVPVGYAGLLERIGEQPLASANDYLLLRDVCASPYTKAADALRACRRITHTTLRIALALDRRWVHANLLSRIDTLIEANDFNCAIDCIQSVSTKATDETVAEAIARMAPTTTTARLLTRMMHRADRLPTHPLGDGDNELRPFTLMRDYVGAARRYRNCLADNLDRVASGAMAIAEFRDECLVEFRPLTTGGDWVVWQVHGHRNRPVPCELTAEAVAACGRFGVPGIRNPAVNPEWRSYRRGSRIFDLDWAA
ncbi:hypothetical protein [Brevundimonas diminuta]|uniref:hypothetical protein n=1 Tax=Brevundimonas diminuta TaxID=293 RepID=UPI0030F9C03D